MYAPSRFGRILDEENRPDLNAYMMMYLELERSGWQLRFVTIELTGNPMIDYVLIAIHATEAANYSTNLSKDVSRGLRNASRQGWWTHAIPPFGTLRFDTRANKVLGSGEASTGGPEASYLSPIQSSLVSGSLQPSAFLLAPASTRSVRHCMSGASVAATGGHWVTATSGTSSLTVHWLARMSSKTGTMRVTQSAHESRRSGPRWST